MVAIRARPEMPIKLGKQGENGIISIEFDISGWIEDLGDGTAVLLHMRPEDESTYPVEITLEDEIVTWVVSSTDTAQAGVGKCELQYVAETGEVIKSETWRTVIISSLEDAGESPDPESGWVADLLESIADIVGTSGTAQTRITNLEEGTISSIVCWGDSLTYQAGWTEVLEEKSGLTVYNAGVGGDTSACIAARQGADPVVVCDITIPAECEAVAIGESAEDGGLTTLLGNKVFLSIPNLSVNPYLNPVTIGDIEGKITFDGDSYTEEGGTWYFTRSEAGDSLEITRPMALRTYYDKVHNRKDELLLLYAIGTNGGYDDINDLILQQKRMIDHFKGKEYVVCGLTWAKSTTDKDEYDAAMVAAFGSRYINVREYLIHPVYDEDGETVISCWGLDDAGLEATEEDLEAIAEGSLPPQLLVDTKHYTDTLKTVIGNMLYLRLRDMGFV